MQSKGNSRSKKKLVPMSTKDYYLKLKEMQLRLENARQDISDNVFRSIEKSNSHSRSISPDLSKVNYDASNFRLSNDLSIVHE